MHYDVLKFDDLVNETNSRTAEGLKQVNQWYKLTNPLLEPYGYRDVINTYGPTKDITYSGKGQSDLEDSLTAVINKLDRYVAPEDHPEAGHYFRSDHFNFARVGVPSLTADGGVDDVAKGTAYGKQEHEEYTAQRYHQPADEYDAGSWNLEGGLADIKVVYNIGLHLADSHGWPGWKAGSEFKAIRDKTAADRK